MPSTPPSSDDLKPYRFPQSAVERLEKWSTEGSYNDLCERHDGPFNEYGSVGLVEHDGKRWMRMKLAMTDAMVDLEMLASGYIGQIIPVAAEEAARIAGSPHKA